MRDLEVLMNITGVKPISSTVWVYLALMVYLILAKIILSFIPVTYTDPSQGAVLQWPSIGILIVAGLIGVFLADRTGFPLAWDDRISNRQRLLIPALLGLVLGIVALVINSLLHLSKVDIAFPASVFVYSAGSIAVEVFYRLVPLPLFLWLISTIMLRNKWQDQIFWILAVLLSVLEPLAQTRALMGLGVTTLSLILIALEIYAANLTQAYIFRRYGFLATLVIRLSYYLIWHVVGSVLMH